MLTKPKSESVRLPGVEIRCANRTVKSYDGVKKVKTCGALLAVVNGAGPVQVDIKCWRCSHMVRYHIG